MIPRLAKSSPLALLTPKEAAAALGISPRKLWSLTASGDVPCVRIGRSVRYDAADLAEFVETLKSAKERPALSGGPDVPGRLS